MKKRLRAGKALLLYSSICLLLVISLGNLTRQEQVSEPDPWAFKSTSNLVFHEISWQYFQWLTEEVKGGKLRFETMYSDQDIYPDLPKKEAVGSFAMQSTKSNILAGINQAASNGILVDQNGRAIYTTMVINDIYRDFVIKNKLYDPQSLRAFPDTTSFPVGAFSLKAAWKIVSPGDDASDYYTTIAKIKRLGYNKDNKIVLTDSLETAKVALVGFHIAVVVNGHPEAIWATFEHVDNAPYAVADQAQDDIVSEDGFTFYKSGTAASLCNNPNSPILKLDPATQILTPATQVFRQFRLGGGNSANQNNIDRLNEQMHSEMQPNSVWRNYFEVGAIWFNKVNALKPNTTYLSSDNTKTALLTGSKLLSNSVIETFTQGASNANQCFGCHNTTALTTVPRDVPIVLGKNVLTSHILVANYLNKAQPVPKNNKKN